MIEADIAVVGGGIAALTAAAEAARRGRRVQVFTGALPGGLLLSIEAVQGLPEHPDGIAGYDLCPMAQEAAMDAGAACIADEAGAVQRDGGRWLVRGADAALSAVNAINAVSARALILAPGSRLRALGVPGEERLAGKGVSHCASCDAPLLRGKTVAVVGGGDAACQEALTLAAHAARVHLLLRGEALRARPAWQQRVQAQPRIDLQPRTEVAEVLGDAAVGGLRLRDGRTLAVDAVFIYIGLQPATEWLAGAPATVALDSDGRIADDAAQGLFAAGTARRGNDGQAATAIDEAVAAARAADEFLA
ncbi:MAG: NAD(P)/FAD-dependent oxidoreductase [Proteobacteria bacterium]|nr:NAD(P)/FAD-dependent oxidoreductase [Pseudomonadota bacterium]